ncbi:putative DNA-binding/iron metalloprotein/AP endonuclease [Anopheles sinensis]|uniref:Putative DNA-binding/iron metalloprotein/AP endonuclease n=1 Tax=Anopheles sinensis TaxID=74873 RepID=A0A084WD18_ANOSI|nr:putative DNA-binding/iron metalloprotein/AP endonuclease [Anopheles sinensis]
MILQQTYGGKLMPVFMCTAGQTACVCLYVSLASIRPAENTVRSVSVRMKRIWETHLGQVLPYVRRPCRRPERNERPVVRARLVEPQTGTDSSVVPHSTERRLDSRPNRRVTVIEDRLYFSKLLFCYENGPRHDRTGKEWWSTGESETGRVGRGQTTLGSIGQPVRI